MQFQKRKYVVYLIIIAILTTTSVVYAGFGRKFLATKSAEAKKNKDENNREKPVENIAPAAEAKPVAEPSQPNESPENNTDSPVDTAPITAVQDTARSEYPLHKNISATYFWVGEDASGDNAHISNAPSAWDEDWLKHFGGVDNPKKRNGYFPAGFTPKENPFYVALPYNDFDENGNHKSNILKLASWTESMKCGPEESYCKNRWVKIMKNGKATYAQWEDVGPFKEDDSVYVFGSALPKSKTNDHAGIDVSPAVHDYLGLGDIDKVDWQFVDDDQVPDGPWKKIVTKSQVFWR
jgi:hypothetical protein